MRSRGESVGEEAKGLEGSDGSGSWGSGRRKVREESTAAEEGAENGRPPMGPPAKVKEEPRLQRVGSMNSNQSFDEGVLAVPFQLLECIVVGLVGRPSGTGKSENRCSRRREFSQGSPVTRGAPIFAFCP